MKVATEEDFDVVYKLANNFIASADFGTLIDDTRIQELLKDFLSGDKKKNIILLYEDYGMILGTVIPFVFGTKTIAAELAWWVNPDKRRTRAGAKLIEAFEYWAKLAGCAAVTATALTDSLGKYYEKHGYKLYDRAYMKEI